MFIVCYSTSNCSPNSVDASDAETRAVGDVNAARLGAQRGAGSEQGECLAEGDLKARHLPNFAGSNKALTCDC